MGMKFGLSHSGKSNEGSRTGCGRRFGPKRQQHETRDITQRRAFGLYFSPNIIRIIELTRMAGACGMYEREEK
jgi:hypothetical protein